jgi:hypothetical protein
MENILLLYAAVAVLIAFGGVTVVLVRRGAVWRNLIASALFAVLILLAYGVLLLTGFS